MRIANSRTAVRVALAIATVTLTAASAFVPVSAFQGFGPGQKAEIKGIIVSRDGDTMSVKTPAGGVTVTITAATQVVQPTGFFKKQTYDITVLLPGLQVDVKGVGDTNGNLIANSVTFSKDALIAAQSANTVVAPVQQQQAVQQQEINQNTQVIDQQAEELAAQQAKLAEQQKQLQMLNTRVSDLADYEVKAHLVVYFPVNGTVVGDEFKAQLAQLAQNATTLKGYLIEVAGYTDPTGPRAYNQQLSLQRSEAVIQYLEQNCNVPLPRILTPSAMGSSHPADPNSTPQAYASNRRVEVSVLVNKGINE